MITKNLPTIILTIGTSVVYLALGYVLLLLSPPNAIPTPNIRPDILLPSPVPLMPKPGDKFVFFGIVLAAPIFALSLYLLARLSSVVRIDAFTTFLTLNATLLILLICSGHLSVLFSPLNTQYFLWTSIGLILTGYFLFRGELVDQISTRKILLATTIAAGLLLAFQRVSTVESVAYSSWYISHGEAVLYAIVHAASGGTCLSDVIAQYGCYNEYVAPILAIIGKSTFVLTTIMAVLQLAGISSALYFASKLIKDPILFFACAAGIFVWTVFHPIPSNPDPILQYYPIRFFFPALSLALVIWLQKRPTNRNFFLSGIFCAIAVSWNLETGLAVLGAILAFSAISGFNATTV